MAADSDQNDAVSKAAATSENASSEPLLEVKDLEVTFQSTTGVVPAVRKANLTLYRGQTVAIVGESGSGKSTLAMSIIGLLPGTGKVAGGSIKFAGRELTTLSEKEMQQVRGAQIGMVPQDPMSNLNQVWKIGSQVAEALKYNEATKGGNIHDQAMKALSDAGLPNAEARSKQYPHEFSGGMRQRALIAIGLAAGPQLLIADEPTSALDVTVQRRILDHLEKETQELGTSTLFITHDLGLAAERASHLVVMHRGRVVESGPAREILNDPRHPYTQRLVNAAPSLASRRIEINYSPSKDEATSGTIDSRTSADVNLAVAAAKGSGQKVMGTNVLGEPLEKHLGEEVIRVEHLVKEFEIRGQKGKKKAFRAVDDVSFQVRRGSTLALVGESGSGKSTVANMILNLLDPTSGKVYYEGIDLSTLQRKQLFALCRKMQVVFQNPYGSLDPMFSVYRCIEEPLRTHNIGDRAKREKRVADLLDMVALPRSAMRRFPNELSGGQRQRVAIARALALRPELVVLDEAVSALDVLVQDQILHLLNELQGRLGLTYLFITHDLAVVRENADDIAVMEQGKLVEYGKADDIFANPQTEYTRELIDAVPGGDLLKARTGYQAG